jgi:hypothetical protein
MSMKLTSYLLAGAVACAPYLCAAAQPATPVADAPSEATEQTTIALPSLTAESEVQPEALWRIVASGQVRTMYKDNIYKAKNDKTGDMIARVLPEVSLISNLDKHALKVSGALDAGKYISEDDNDFIDGHIDATGRYDITDTLSFNPSASWRDDHVDVGSFEDEPEIRNKKPTDYRYGEAGGSLDFHPEAYLVQLGGAVNFYDYDNVERRNGTININDDRDRTETREWAKLGYNIESDIMLYTLGGIDQRSYDKRVDGTLLNGRDSDGRTLRVGAMLGKKEDFKWLDINLGYLDRNYDDSFYRDVNTFGFDVEGFYQVAADWSLDLNARRSIEENTLNATSSFIKSTINTELAYHLSPKTELAGNVGYTLNDFQVNKSLGLLQREDKIYEAGSNARYRINDIYKVDLGYNYTKRTSNNASVEYNANTVMLSLIANLN